MKIKYVGNRDGEVHAKGRKLIAKKEATYDLPEHICKHLEKTGLWKIVKSVKPVKTKQVKST